MKKNFGLILFVIALVAIAVSPMWLITNHACKIASRDAKDEVYEELAERGFGVVHENKFYVHESISDLLDFFYADLVSRGIGKIEDGKFIFDEKFCVKTEQEE